MPLKIINEKKFIKLPKAILFDTDNTLYSYAPSNELALKFLNWSPKYSIKEMCKDGWDWYESRKN